jgi:methionine sulfoxide reductase heme-binding subunit
MSTAPHLFWITSRASGSAALITSSLAVTLGILIGARRSRLARLSELRPVHEALSLATLALIALHGLSLLGDSFLHPGLAGIAVPLGGPYRPGWTAVGIVGGYGLGALGLSYYARNRIGAATWRKAHRFTSFFWVLAVVHAVGSGSDSWQLWFLLLCGIAVLPAAVLAGGRTARGLASVLDLPRSQSPVRSAR